MTFEGGLISYKQNSIAPFSCTSELYLNILYDTTIYRYAILIDHLGGSELIIGAL